MRATSRAIAGYRDYLVAERPRRARLVYISVGVLYLRSQGGAGLRSIVSAFASRGFCFCLSFTP